MKLTTAKEWIDDLRKRERPSGEANLVGWVTESEIAEVQRNALEAAAALCERVRCRTWSPEECAMQIRSLLIPENPAPTAGKDDHE